MRLWTLHPKYLDAKGLVALWREALLAQAVLAGRTRGYTRHPQLERFRRDERPLAAIATYLRGVLAEARERDYRFDGTKISRARLRGSLHATDGQLEYEWNHLLAKVLRRDPDRYRLLTKVERPSAHPIFRVRHGGVAEWEVRA
jgi:hypothetical protein